jgi:2-amino-4-hydroxy-6-hydroxymethyldihydropteridine diphosphokinase
MPVVYLGLGSNLGDRAANLWLAVYLLASRTDTRDVVFSRLYETEPVGRVNQPNFLNAAAKLEVDLGPAELLNALKRIETELGRSGGERWGPRVIDLDILLYGDREMESPELSIPHRELWRRRFVLEPLREIVSDVELAGQIRTALHALPEQPHVWAYPPIDPVSRSV